MPNAIQRIKNLSALKVSLSAMLLISTAMPARSALPPQFQNRRDLEVMVDFINRHPKVARMLKIIDIRNATIEFDESCMAFFEREPQQGIIMPGPAQPLAFKSSNCAVE